MTITEAKRRAAVLSCQTMARYLRDHEGMPPEARDAIEWLDEELVRLANLIPDEETT